MEASCYAGGESIWWRRRLAGGLFHHSYGAKKSRRDAGATKLHEEWICRIAKSIRELVLPEYRAGEFRSGGRHRETCGYRISVRVLFEPTREAPEFSAGRSCTRVPARAMQCSDRLRWP